MPDRHVSLVWLAKSAGFVGSSMDNRWSKFGCICARRSTVMYGSLTSGTNPPPKFSAPHTGINANMFYGAQTVFLLCSPHANQGGDTRQNFEGKKAPFLSTLVWMAESVLTALPLVFGCRNSFDIAGQRKVWSTLSLWCCGITTECWYVVKYCSRILGFSPLNGNIIKLAFIFQ